MRAGGGRGWRCWAVAAVLALALPAVAEGLDVEQAARLGVPAMRVMVTVPRPSCGPFHAGVTNGRAAGAS